MPAGQRCITWPHSDFLKASERRVLSPEWLSHLPLGVEKDPAFPEQYGCHYLTPNCCPCGKYKREIMTVRQEINSVCHISVQFLQPSLKAWTTWVSHRRSRAVVSPPSTWIIITWKIVKKRYRCSVPTVALPIRISIMESMGLYF